MIFEHGRGRDDLEDGTGRQLRLNRAIQQGMQRVVVELLPLLVRNANGEIIGIRSGAADHGEHFAGARIERHHRAGSCAERLLRDLLQIVVDGELNLLARNGFLLGRPVLTSLPTLLTMTRRMPSVPVKDIVVLALQAGFADEVAGAELAVAGFNLLVR